MPSLGEKVSASMYSSRQIKWTTACRPGRQLRHAAVIVRSTAPPSASRRPPLFTGAKMNGTAQLAATARGRS